jgi:DNA-binding PadR family transcriptional regulator
MADRAPTDFEHVLIGLVARSPSSAYDLKKLFASSPASVYQPSAGALVPALRRLVHRGYLTVEVDPGPHLRRVHRVTALGRRAHLDWLRRPVDPDTVGRDLGSHLMRFVLMEPEVSSADVRAFLTDLADALERFVASIEAFVATTPLPGRHPTLALHHGVAVHRASLTWARETLAALSTPPPHRPPPARIRRTPSGRSSEVGGPVRGRSTARRADTAARGTDTPQRRSGTGAPPRPVPRGADGPSRGAGTRQGRPSHPGRV